MLKPGVRGAVLSLREGYLQRRDHKLSALQDQMDVGKFGGEIVRHMRRQIEIECEWIRRLRRIERSIEE